MLYEQAIVELERHTLLRTWAIFELCVPFLHLSGIALTRPTDRKVPKRHLVRQALVWGLLGGKRTFICQAVSWILFICSLLVALALFVTPAHHQVPLITDNCTSETIAGNVMLISATFSAAASLLFMFKSILLFDPTSDPLAVINAPWVQLRLGTEAITWDIKRLPSPKVAASVVVLLGVLWTALGASLLLASSMLDGGARIMYAIIAVACFTIGSFGTYGIGGHLLHHKSSQRRARWPVNTAATPTKSSLDDSQETNDTPNSPTSSDASIAAFDEDEPVKWRFFQPFQGGYAFVATQAFGWALYSIALALTAWSVAELLLGAAHTIAAWPLAAGTSAVVAEIVLVVSLLTYNTDTLPHSWRLITVSSVKDFATRTAVISVLYVQIHCFVAFAILTFVVIPAMQALTLWIGSLFIYYTLTGFTAADHYGHREWHAFRNWIGRHAEKVLPLWLGSLEVVLDKGAEFEPAEKYILAYTPHGMFPLGAAYLPLLPSFKRLAPCLNPVTLVASICFAPPVVRDLLSWTGLRSVNRQTFVKALRERGSVLMCPGGQAELVHASRMHKFKEYVVYTKHKGFVKVAMDENASLVPIVVMGEVDSLRNVLAMPKVQSWTYKRLGFPFPFLMGGRFGILPLPSKTGIKFIIGKPIPPPTGKDASIELYHKQFYDACEDIWMRHKEQFPRYKDVRYVRI